MRGALNDGVRWLLGRLIGALGVFFDWIERVRIAAHPFTQRRLRRRFAVTADTPILAYGPQVEAQIAARAAQLGERARYAVTSGSSAAPKRLLYSRGRLMLAKLVFSDVYTRACRAFRLRRRSLFLLSALGDDGSLTARLLAERTGPSALATLQAPYRVQAHPVFAELVERYGATAVRLFLLTAANPGVLYATNPSTLSTFLDSVATDWLGARALALAFVTEPDRLPAALHRVTRRLVSRGASARLAAVAASPTPLPVATWAPGVEAYMTWTGGYVAPFLERVRRHLPADRYRSIPMYSMSTETIETVSHFRVDDPTAFLPLAPGVLYEFLELLDEGAPDLAARLLAVDALAPGKAYTLVVSDGYGLRRYQTGDVFLCRRRVGRLPDLVFLRRRGLEHSFTGEKLTAQQASRVFDRARAGLQLPASTYLTLVPSWPPDEAVPHYRLVVVGEREPGQGELADLARLCESELEAENAEYRSKVGTGRLGRLRPLALSAERFAQVVGGPRHRASWEAQFKFLPLYRTRWEALVPPAAGGPALESPRSPARG